MLRIDDLHHPLSDLPQLVRIESIRETDDVRLALFHLRGGQRQRQIPQTGNDAAGLLRRDHPVTPSLRHYGEPVGQILGQPHIRARRRTGNTIGCVQTLRHIQARLTHQLRTMQQLHPHASQTVTKSIDLRNHIEHSGSITTRRSTYDGDSIQDSLQLP